MRTIFVVSVLIAQVGCSIADSFVCQRDEQCRDGARTGTCEPNGYCSFPDPNCPSGSSYDVSAGALAGVCVAPPSTWWNTAWSTRVPLVISNTAAQTIDTGFQVGTQLDLDAAPCAGPRDAVRIVYATTDVERVIDELGADDEWIWFRLQAPIASNASSTDYWLYCGNPSPPAAAHDPTHVFDFFDGFDGGLDPSRWMVTNTVAVANGVATIGGSAAVDNDLITTATFVAGTAVDVVATAPVGNYQLVVGFRNGSNNTPPWVTWNAGEAMLFAAYWGTSGGAKWTSTERPIASTPTRYGVENYGAKAMFRMQNAPAETHIYDVAPATATMNVMLHVGSYMLGIPFDEVRTRRAVDPPPTLVAGTPERL